ncbi:unnamed protein product, partial [Rotaria socialis]
DCTVRWNLYAHMGIQSKLTPPSNVKSQNSEM